MSCEIIKSSVTNDIADVGSIVDAVGDNFDNLMLAAVGDSSVYTMSKDTLESFLTEGNDGTMTAVEKSNVLANMLGSVTTSITNAAMNAAIEIAKEDRDSAHALAKVEEDILASIESRNLTASQNCKIQAETNEVDKDRELKILEGWKIQANLRVEDDIDVTELSVTEENIILPNSVFGDDGTQHAMKDRTKKETDVKSQDILKTRIEGWVLQTGLFVDNGYDSTDWALEASYDSTGTIVVPVDNKIIDPINDFKSKGSKFNTSRQNQATTYATYAKSYRDAGIVDYSMDDHGNMTIVTPNPIPDENSSGKINPNAGITYAQTKVAIRQEQGFDENILQHVANSSASFMGLLLSGEQSDKAVSCLNPADGSPLAYWGNAIAKMNVIAGADGSDAIPCAPTT